MKIYFLFFVFLIALSLVSAKPKAKAKAKPEAKPKAKPQFLVDPSKDYTSCYPAYKCGAIVGYGGYDCYDKYCTHKGYGKYGGGYDCYSKYCGHNGNDGYGKYGKYGGYTGYNKHKDYTYGKYGGHDGYGKYGGYTGYNKHKDYTGSYDIDPPNPNDFIKY